MFVSNPSQMAADQSSTEALNPAPTQGSSYSPFWVTPHKTLTHRLRAWLFNRTTTGCQPPAANAAAIVVKSSVGQSSCYVTTCSAKRRKGPSGWSGNRLPHSPPLATVTTARDDAAARGHCFTSFYRMAVQFVGSISLALCPDVVSDNQA